MQTDPKNYTGIVQGFRKIAGEQGIKGLFRGWVPTAIGYSAQGAFKVRSPGVELAAARAAAQAARGSGSLEHPARPSPATQPQPRPHPFLPGCAPTPLQFGLYEYFKK